VITNAIPANSSFVSASSSQGSYTNNGNAIVCALGTLTNGASATLTATFQTRLPGTITNVATVTAAQPDHALLNNTASGIAMVSVPALTIGGVTVVEPSSGTTNAVFPLTLSAPSIQTLSVNYLTADNT